MPRFENSIRTGGSPAMEIAALALCVAVFIFIATLPWWAFPSVELGSKPALFVGIAVVFGALTVPRQWRQIRLLRAARVANPDAPWLWRADWASRHIHSSTSGEAKQWVISAVVFNAALVFAAVYLVPAEVLQSAEVSSITKLNGGLLSAIGVGMLAYALWRGAQARRFGRTAFILNTLPVALGNRLVGEIELPESMEGTVPVDLRLRCRRQITRHSSDSRGRSQRTVYHETIWEDSRIAAASSRATHSVVPVEIAVPAHPEPTTRLNRGDGVYWVLEARANLQGPDLYVVFEVPVFRPALDMGIGASGE